MRIQRTFNIEIDNAGTRHESTTNGVTSITLKFRTSCDEYPNWRLTKTEMKRLCSDQEVREYILDNLRSELRKQSRVIDGRFGMSNMLITGQAHVAGNHMLFSASLYNDRPFDYVDMLEQDMASNNDTKWGVRRE